MPVIQFLVIDSLVIHAICLQKSKGNVEYRVAQFACILKQAIDLGLSLKGRDTDKEERKTGEVVMVLSGLPWPGLTVLGMEDHVLWRESLGLFISS